MQRILPPEQRLVVSADFKPATTPAAKSGAVETLNKRDQVRTHVLNLADKLYGTGVYFKVNSALRACGYDLIGEIRARGLRVFADLKLFDIPETLSTDGMLLAEVRPDILTVSLAAGASSLAALKAQLPHTELLGVTVLTSHTDEDTRAQYMCSTDEAVMRLARFGAEANIDGLVCSPAEAQALRAKYGLLLTLNAPAVRPLHTIVDGDDQNPARVMTPSQAIQAGADRVVIGRPITQSKHPRAVVERVILEIASI